MDFNIVSFPLEQIGWCLRQLSLSGTVGNLVAIVLYVLIGAIPCGIFLLLKKKGRSSRIDYMLLVISALLLGNLYFMINPGLLPINMLGHGTEMLALTFYSVLLAYLVLRFVLEKSEENLDSLQKGLRFVLYVVMVVFALSVVLEGAVNLPAAIKNVQEANSGAMDPLAFLYGVQDLKMTYVFLTLQSIVKALPDALSVVVTFLCIRVLDELLLDSYSEKAVVRVKKVAVFCKNSLIAIVVSEVIVNVGQLLFSNQLYQINVMVNIPIFSIFFLLVIHVMARYIEENQKLKQDNDLFI